MISFVLALTLTAPAVDLSTLSADARYDLSCAEAAGWALSWMKDESDRAPERVRDVAYFYQGRLSGRDNSTNWIAVVRERLTAHRESEKFYSEALEGCVQRMADKMLTTPR